MIALIISCLLIVVQCDVIHFGSNQTHVCQQHSCSYQTENFPNPYPPVKPTFLTFPVNQGKGIRFLFTEFLMADDESLTICDANKTKCDTKTGDDFKHRRTHAFFASNGQATIEIGKQSDVNGTKSPLRHTGFTFITQYFDISSPSFECISLIDLTKSSPSVLLSPGYPSSMEHKVNCTTTVTTANNIRVLLYDFNFYGIFTVTGTDFYTVKPVSNNFFGYATGLTTVASYYSGNVEINYYCDPSANITCGSRFFVILEMFNNAPKAGCQGAKNINYPVDKGVSFYTNNYNYSAYSNNMFCNISATVSDGSENVRIGLKLALESEPWIDHVRITGLFHQNSTQKDDWDLSAAFSSIIFAETNQLQVTFSADFAEQAVGLSGEIVFVDCSCPKSGHADISTNNFTTSTPGYGNSFAFTYCPNIDCEWSVAFHPKYVALVNLGIPEFRSGTSFSFEDAVGRRIYSTNPKMNLITPSFIVTDGLVKFHFNSSSESQFDMTEDKQGAQIAVTLSEFYCDKNVTKNITIDKGMTVAIDPEKSDQSCSRFTVNIYSTTRLNVVLYESPTEGYLDFFDGALTTENSTALLPARFTQNGGLKTVQTTQTSMTVRYFGIGSADQHVKFAVLPVQDPKCTVPYLAYLAEGSTLNVELSSPNAPTCQTIVFHNSSSNYGINLGGFKSSAVQVFRGVAPDKDKEFVKNKMGQLPYQIYAQFLTLQYASNISNIQISSAVPKQVYEANCEPQSIVTVDYLAPSNFPGHVAQQFTVQNTNKSAPNDLKIELHNLDNFEGGSLSISIFDSTTATTPSTTKELSNWNKDDKLVFKGSTAKFTYNSLASSSGLYMEFTICNTTTGTASNQLKLPILLIIFTFLSHLLL